MSVCIGSLCSKKEHCMNYIGNYNSDKVEQVVNWSTCHYKSTELDEKGHTYLTKYYCGDLSKTYPKLIEKELNPEKEWIPCSISNPKDFGKYLVTCKGKDIPQIRLFDGVWDSISEVIAWRELPEIYR